MSRREGNRVGTIEARPTASSNLLRARKKARQPLPNYMRAVPISAFLCSVYRKGAHHKARSLCADRFLSYGQIHELHTGSSIRLR